MILFVVICFYKDSANHWDSTAQKLHSTQMSFNNNCVSFKATVKVSIQSEMLQCYRKWTWLSACVTIHSNRSGLSRSGFSAGWSSGKVSDKDWPEHIRRASSLQNSVIAQNVSVVESRIRGAGGSCLCFLLFAVIFDIIAIAAQSDGWRTRTPGRTTPTCGSSAEAAARSGTVNPSWSSVSTDYRSWYPR